MIRAIAKQNFNSTSLQPQPDFFVVNSNENIECGLWVKGETGIIGHFKTSDTDKIKEVLDFCCQFLATKNCSSVLGPMNGNTWHSYRFVSWSIGRPPFLLEPYQPESILNTWLEFGFTVDQAYISSEQTISEINENKYTLDPDYQLSHIDLEHFESELDLLYQLSIQSFADNIYYSDISRDDFFSLYLPLKNKIQSKNMLLLKTASGDIAGYLFGMPDLLQKNPDTYIIKTLAIHPQHRSKQLGSYLGNHCLCDAYKSGYKKIIHALMHESNQSAKMGKGFEIIRRYVLLRKAI